MIMVPSDLFFMFECQSLRNASPLFIGSVGLINTCDEDVQLDDLFARQLKLIEKKHGKFLDDFRVNF